MAQPVGSDLFTNPTRRTRTVADDKKDKGKVVQQDHESMEAAGKPIASTSDIPGAGVTAKDYGKVKDIDEKASSATPKR